MSRKAVCEQGFWGRGNYVLFPLENTKRTIDACMDLYYALLKFTMFCASNLQCTNVLCLLPLRLLQDYLTADYACAAQYFNAVVNDWNNGISWMHKHHTVRVQPFLTVLFLYLYDS